MMGQRKADGVDGGGIERGVAGDATNAVGAEELLHIDTGYKVRDARCEVWARGGIDAIRRLAGDTARTCARASAGSCRRRGRRRARRSATRPHTCRGSRGQATRMAARPMTTRKKALERFIMMTWPSRTSLEVRSSGYAKTVAPSRKALIAHSHGMRHSGAANIEKPVAMPRGGMRIFLEVTAVRPSCTRQTMTPAAPTRAASMDNSRSGKRDSRGNRDN